MLMQRSIGLKLSNLVTVIFVTSVICLVMACGLAVITGECDLFLFIQVMGYFFLVAASVLFFWMTFNIKNDGAFLWQVFLAALIFRVVAVVALYFRLHACEQERRQSEGHCRRLHLWSFL